ncbi:MAG: DeoR/GlpR family DNA-binding transcription regulator [Christensenellaceae bacterium]
MNKNHEDSIFAEERKHLIVELVNKNVKTTVINLCERFGVSPATIRNDLRELEEAGLLKRTHGGAISNTKANYEPNAYQKEVENVEEKKMIAKYAAKYVQEGDTIVLDTGTTTFELAKLLVNYNDLTVITNDLQIAAFLERNAKANIIMAGGAVRRNFHCTAGQKAIDTISDLNADKCFLGANGVSIARGVTTPNIDTAYVKTKLVELGAEVILLVDSTKIEKANFVRFADLAQIDILITDEHANSEYVEKIEEKDVLVEIAK